MTAAEYEWRVDAVQPIISTCHGRLGCVKQNFETYPCNFHAILEHDKSVKYVKEERNHLHKLRFLCRALYSVISVSAKGSQGDPAHCQE